MIYFGREYCTAKKHIPSECPICSQLNTKVGDPGDMAVASPTTPPSLKSETLFTPKKRAKGIIYYEDRLSELRESPGIATFVKQSDDAESS